MTATPIVPLSLSLARRRRVGRRESSARAVRPEAFSGVVYMRPEGGQVSLSNAQLSYLQSAGAVYIRPDGTAIPASYMTDAEREHVEQVRRSCDMAGARPVSDTVDYLRSRGEAVRGFRAW